MSDIMGLEIPAGLPKFGGFTVYIFWIIGFILLLIIAAVVIYYFNKRMLYKYSIVVFDNISGQGWKLAPKDKARMIRVAQDGTEQMFLKNRKIPLEANGAKKMGTNQYWFAKASDGTFRNIVIGDLDTKLGVLDIEPVDRDIKMSVVNALKQSKEEYGPKITFMQKYGVLIINILAVAIILFGMFYITKEMGTVAEKFGSVAETLKQAMAQTSNIGLVGAA